MKTLDWFIKRIGKTIYRDSDGCSCGTCKNIVENGIKIHDKQHAQYMFDTQNDWVSEGIMLNYRDEK